MFHEDMNRQDNFRGYEESDMRLKDPSSAHHNGNQTDRIQDLRKKHTAIFLTAMVLTPASSC